MAGALFLGMRRIISFTILALTVTGGVALADRGHWDRGGNRGGWDRSRNASGGVVVRDQRWNGGGVVRDHRDHNWGGRVAAPGWHAPRQHFYRRPVFVNNGYYQFHNGYRYAYSRPIIRHRYFDYRVRPQIIVENTQPIYGYVW